MHTHGTVVCVRKVVPFEFQKDALCVGVAYLTETPAAEAIPVVAAFARFWPSFPLLVTGQPGEDGRALAKLWLPFPEAMSKIARTHVDEATRLDAAVNLTTLEVFPMAVKHGWNWEGLFGTDGEVLVMAVRGYNYDVRLPISVPFM